MEDTPELIDSMMSMTEQLDEILGTNPFQRCIEMWEKREQERRP